MGEGEHKFDFLDDFLRATVDMADLVGIYFVMSRVAGRGSVKVLVAGLGWGFAELAKMLFLATFFPMSSSGSAPGGWSLTGSTSRRVLTPTSPFLHFISLASLVWMWTKRNTTHGPGVTGVLSVVLGVACYKGLIVSGAATLLELGSWAKLVQDGLITSCLALVSLQLYLGVTSTEKF